MTSDSTSNKRGRLELPHEVGGDIDSIELLTVWYTPSKIHVMTRSGTRLDENPALWGEIMATIAENIVSRQRHLKSPMVEVLLGDMKSTFDSKWQQLLAQVRSEHD